MQDLGLVAGTYESLGTSIPNVHYTQMPTPAQTSLSLPEERWPLRTEPAGHSQLGQSGPGPHQKSALPPAEQKQADRCNWHYFEWISVCPDFSGGQKAVSSSEASGSHCCRTNQSFLGLAVYYVFVFRGHTQVSDPLTGVRRLVWTSAVLSQYLGRETPGSRCANLGRWVLAVSGDA